MEDTEAAYCTASGMAAISAVVTQICNAGDHVVVSDTIYGGSFALFHDYLPKKMGLRVSFVDITDLSAVEAALQDDTKLVYTETLANPTLKLANLPALAELAHGVAAKLVVDNTFTPLMITPVHHGADVVVHSLTKYINGASDIVAGCVCGSTEFIGSLMDLHEGSLMLLGPTMDPNQAAAINLRLPHLPLRIKEHSARGLIFAQRLSEQGYKVIYPGLPEHPAHALWPQIAHAEYGYGGLLALDMGNSERAFKLMEILQNKESFGYMAVSLGYFDTLMSCSAASTSSELDEQALSDAGIAPGLVRMSLGFTGSVEQRWAQLQRALALV